MQLVEPCDEETRNLITTVWTTPAVSDDAATLTSYTALDFRGLLPKVYLADSGFVNSSVLVVLRERYRLDLIGLTLSIRRWPAQAGAGFDAWDFLVAFTLLRASCPARKSSQISMRTLGCATPLVITIELSVTAGRARSGSITSSRFHHYGRSRFAPSPKMRCCASEELASRPQTLRPTTRGASASRGQLHRACGGLGYGGHRTFSRRERTWLS